VNAETSDGDPTAAGHQDDLDSARHQGRLEAAVFDSRLRAVEEAERKYRDARLVLERADGEPTVRPVVQADAAIVERLRRNIDQLAEFQLAVNRSRAWRLIQMLRRIVGRAW